MIEAFGDAPLLLLGFPVDLSFAQTCKIIIHNFNRFGQKFMQVFK